MKSIAYKREYQREWRKRHPYYTRNWNRLHRNTRITDINAPNQTRHEREKNKISYLRVKKGHCLNCTILLTSLYAGKSNKNYCETCSDKLSTVKPQL